MRKVKDSTNFQQGLFNLRIFKILLLPIGLLILSSGHALELSTNFRYGIDSNPKSLSDRHNPSQDNFVYGDVKVTANYEKRLYLKAQAKRVEYSDDDRASWSKVGVDIDYKSKFKVGKQTVKYQLSIDAADRDSTYVSKSTGLIGVFGGQSIADRYDSRTTNFNAEMSYRTKQKTKFTLGYQRRNKDYEDFSIVGLSDLDYRHNKVNLDIDYRLSDVSRMIFELSKIDRKYLDRRADSSDGSDIPGTDLELNYTGYKLGYIFKPDKKIRWKYAINFLERSDNNSGYQDNEYTTMAISLRYKMESARQIAATLKYSDISYLNQRATAANSFEEEDREKKGFKLKLNYLHPLGKQTGSLPIFFAELNVADFDSLNPDYEYQQTSLSAGLRWQLP